MRHLAALVLVLFATQDHFDFTRMFASPEAEKSQRAELFETVRKLEAMRGEDRG